MDPFKPKYQQKEKQEEIHINEPQLEKNESEICLNLLRMLGNAFNLIAPCFQGWSWRKCCIVEDEEIPKKSSQRTITEGQSSYANQSEKGKAYQFGPQHQKIHMTLLNFVKRAIMMYLFIILRVVNQRLVVVVAWITACILKHHYDHDAAANLIGRIEKIKRKNMLACQIMDELVQRTSRWPYQEHGREPRHSDSDGSKGKQPMDKPDGDSVSESPILMAAKNGILEMVKKILDAFPTSIEDLDSNNKNIVLLAVEFRHPHIYQYMLQRKIMKKSIFGAVDSNGNSALHLAAMVRQQRVWLALGPLPQILWEIKWYKFIEKSMEADFFQRYNSEGQTAWEMFTQKNESLHEVGDKWVTDTCQSCSVIAALIATVALTSATTVPGGLRQDSGFPVLEGQTAFNIFAIAAFVASCFSVSSLIVFLRIITYRYQGMDLVNVILCWMVSGLVLLIISIDAMLFSFYAGHFYVLGKTLKPVAYRFVHAIIDLPSCLLVAMELYILWDLGNLTFAQVPGRTYEKYFL